MVINSEMRGCVLEGKLFDKYGIGISHLEVRKPFYLEREVLPVPVECTIQSSNQRSIHCYPFDIYTYVLKYGKQKKSHK